MVRRLPGQQIPCIQVQQRCGHGWRYVMLQRQCFHTHGRLDQRRSGTRWAAFFWGRWRMGPAELEASFRKLCLGQRCCALSLTAVQSVIYPMDSCDIVYYSKETLMACWSRKVRWELWMRAFASVLESPPCVHWLQPQSVSDEGFCQRIMRVDENLLLTLKTIIFRHHDNSLFHVQVEHQV